MRAIHVMDKEMALGNFITRMVVTTKVCGGTME